jgi:hypothetical protein
MPAPPSPGLVTGDPQYTGQQPGKYTPVNPNAGNAPTSVQPTKNTVAGPTGVAAMTPAQVRATQTFLSNHGLQVATDGMMGPQTKSAIAAWHAISKLPPAARGKAEQAWTTKFGTGTHPAAQTGTTDAGGGDQTSTTTRTVQSTGTTPASQNDNGFQQLLAQLMADGGSAGTPYNVNAIGNAAAAPDAAAAQTLLQQIAQNPRQGAQDQADISSWFGLNPTDPNYKQSVLGLLANAKAGDQTSATQTAGNDSSLAKALAASIGGAANDGSGSVAAAGANAAGTAGAIGQVNSDYANNMSPLLAAEARGDMSKTQAANQQAKLVLQQQLAQARGQETADRSTAETAAQGQNNSLTQQAFANKGNVLSTIAQMQAIDPNKNYLADQRTQAEINADNARTRHENVLTQKVVNAPSDTKAPKGSFAASSTQDRVGFTKTIMSSIIGSDGKPIPGMTRAKAMLVAQHAARVYFPNGGIPPGTGIIAAILQQAGY